MGDFQGVAEGVTGGRGGFGYAWLGGSCENLCGWL